MPFPVPRSEADDLLQGEDAQTEMDDTLSQRLSLGVRPLTLPVGTLLLRQFASDQLGHLGSQVIDREPVTGQHGSDRVTGPVDNLGEGHLQLLERGHDTEDQVAASILCGWEDSSGENGKIACWKEEGCAAHGPALQQALVLGDRSVDRFPSEIGDAGIEREQSRSGRTVLNPADSSGSDQGPLVQAPIQVLRLKAVRDDLVPGDLHAHSSRLSRRLLGHIDGVSQVQRSIA